MKIPLLNLLPADRKQLLRQTELAHILRSSALALGIAAALALVILLAARMGLDRSVEVYEAKAQAAQEATIAAQGELLDVRIRTLNDQLVAVQQLQKDYVAWSGPVHDLGALIPIGVRLTGIDIDRATRLMTLQGNAATRDALIALQTALEHAPAFEEPSSPVSNLLERENIVFTMTAKIVLP